MTINSEEVIILKQSIAEYLKILFHALSRLQTLVALIRITYNSAEIRNQYRSSTSLHRPSLCVGDCGQNFSYNNRFRRAILKVKAVTVYIQLSFVLRNNSGYTSL